MFSLAELERASDLVYSVLPLTPQFCWPLLCQRAGCEVWVKHENHTPISAFKVRGGLVYLDELRKGRGRTGGAVAATRGNHGQSLAFAAKRVGLPLAIVVPRGNSLEKNASMRAFQAELIERGRDFDEARVVAGELAAERGWEFVPSFDPLLVRGVATYARELFEAVRELETVYVPIGLGSGICGMIRVRDLLGLRTRIIGVVAEGAPAYALSLEAGRIVETEHAHTIADGLACRVPDARALEIIRGGAERIVRVSDEEIVRAMRALFSDTHNLAEGAGAAAMAALLQEREAMAGRRVAVILTGGNIDLELFLRLTNENLPGH